MTQGMPAKWLAPLTAAVVAVHLVVLQAAPLLLSASSPASATPVRPLVTRTLTPVAAPVTRLAPTPTPVKPRVRAQRATAVAVPTPQVATLAPVTLSPEPVVVAAAPLPESPELPTPSAAPPPPDAPEDKTPSPSAATVPDSALLRYEVSSNKLPFTVNGTFSWQQDGSTYEAQLSYSAFGFSRSQSSRGAVSATGLAPERFADKLRNEVAAHFNHEAHKVTFSANTPDVALQPGAQDRLSVLIQLGAQIAASPERYTEGTTASYQTVGPRDAATWVFTVQASETLSLPGGEMQTLKLVRNPRQDYDQKVELWLAPALGYLPARIRITEHNGDAIDQKWLATETSN
jgi:hypothetical protein